MPLTVLRGAGRVITLWDDQAAALTHPKAERHPETESGPAALRETP
ncbi:hypothetical protein Acsp04_29090 [Actinomadura sp. NBRC 104425]|nr:hypothetical protein [Actinomadura sp. NBRC 104425]GLZ12674.1 hypothetical protein Acsp04_29090 [Actinomadura sp. NBRC 104425]